MKKKSTYQFNFIDNQGTSMIELLVVMAIMAVLLGTATNIVGYLSGKQAKQCAYKMDAILSETRMETMSKSTGEKDSVYLTIKNENGKIYAVQKIKDNEMSTLLGNSVKIVARDIQGSEMELGNGTSFNVYFIFSIIVSVLNLLSLIFNLFPAVINAPSGQVHTVP